MRDIRQKVIKFNIRYHMLIHTICGLLVAVFIRNLFPQAPFHELTLLCIFASVLPDADHFLYFYTYGRHAEYSKTVRDFIKKKQIRNFLHFAGHNHKNLQGLYSHNIGSLFAATAFFFVLLFKGYDSYFTLAFAMSVMLHFIYDILEDILFSGRINPNWFFKFSKDIGEKPK